jgi:hypothetical protein
MNKFGENLRSLREIFIVSRRNSLIFAEEPAFQVDGFIQKYFVSLLNKTNLQSSNTKLREKE